MQSAFVVAPIVIVISLSFKFVIIAPSPSDVSTDKFIWYLVGVKVQLQV